MDPQHLVPPEVDVKEISGKVNEAKTVTEKKKYMFRPSFPFYFDTEAVTIIGSLGEEPSEGHFLISNKSQRPYIYRIQVSNFKPLFKIEPNLGIISCLSELEVNVKFYGDALPHQQVYLKVTAVAAENNEHRIETLFSKKNYVLHKKLQIDYLLWHDIKGYREGRCAELFDRGQNRILNNVNQRLLSSSVRVQEKLYEAGKEARPTWPMKKLVTVKKWAEMEM